MGKLVNYIPILSFIDLMFLITGQLTTVSPTSIIIGAVLNPETMLTTQFYLVFLGIVGIAGISATAGVTSGIVTRGIDVLAFTAMALALSTMLGDFISIFLVLRSINVVLATVIMAPLIMLFVVTIAEWLRGKD